MASKKWDWSFNLDAAAGETKEFNITLDGKAYTAIISPRSEVDEARKSPRRIGLGDSIEKTSMTLGPRPGGCPYCGR